MAYKLLLNIFCPELRDIVCSFLSVSDATMAGHKRECLKEIRHTQQSVNYKDLYYEDPVYGVIWRVGAHHPSWRFSLTVTTVPRYNRIAQSSNMPPYPQLITKKMSDWFDVRYLDMIGDVDKQIEDHIEAMAVWHSLSRGGRDEEVDRWVAVERQLMNWYGPVFVPLS